MLQWISRQFCRRKTCSALTTSNSSVTSLKIFIFQKPFEGRGGDYLSGVVTTPFSHVTTPPLGHHMIRYIRYLPKEKKNMAAVLQSLRSRSYAVGQLICQPNSVRRYEIFNLFVTTNVCATCLAHAPNGGINVQVFFQLDGCSRFWCESCRTWIGGILSPEHFGERRTGPRVCQNRYKSLNVVGDYFTGRFCRFYVFLETDCNPQHVKL